MPSSLKNMTMIKITLVLLLAFVALVTSSQKLIDVYKTGTVKLVPDSTYAIGNDWDKVFASFNDTLSHKHIGNRKSLLVLPDGSVVVNNAYTDFYTKFTPDGTFDKEFGIVSANGQRLKKINNINGIINGRIFYTGLDNMGKMVCMDFNGKYVKTLTLDYMAKQMISLPNNKIAVVGWSIWKNKFRDFVAIVDYNTNQQKVIWEHFTERVDIYGDDRPMFCYGHQFKQGGSFSFSSMPYSRQNGLVAPPKLTTTGNSLVIALPHLGDLLVYDLNGVLKSKEKIAWENDVITVEEQKVLQLKALQDFKARQSPIWHPKSVPLADVQAATNKIKKQMEDDLAKIKEPIQIPYFSTLMKDSDGNILFFEYPKQEFANRFNVWVFTNSGSFKCQSTFVCDDYNLEINPAKMVFHNGYIYALQTLKNASGVPLRLVRFTIASD
jgi:hypothetical protein